MSGDDVAVSLGGDFGERVDGKGYESKRVHT